MKRVIVVLCFFIFGCHNCSDSIEACGRTCEKAGKVMQKYSDYDGCICEAKK